MFRYHLKSTLLILHVYLIFSNNYIQIIFLYLCIRIPVTRAPTYLFTTFLQALNADCLDGVITLKQIFISFRFSVYENTYFYRNKQISLTLHRMYSSGDHLVQYTTTHGPCLSLSPEMVRTHIAPTSIHRALIYDYENKENKGG